MPRSHPSHKIGYAALERLIEEAIARFMPDLAAGKAETAAERRRFDIETRTVSFVGTVRVEGELDLADALDVEDAIQAVAASLKAAGSQDSLDVRRSIALGDLARHQPTLDLTGNETTPAAKKPKPRQVILHVHLSDAALTGQAGLHLARVQNQHKVVTADQVRTWCANPDTSVVVKPVIDLNEHIHVNGYEVPERLQEQTEERDTPACSPGAPDQRGSAIRSTASPTTRAAPPAPATSHPCVDAITG